MRASLTKYAGPAGIAILWLSVGLSLLTTRFDVLARKPISYLGVYQDSRLLFNTGLLVSASLLIVFATYLRKTFKPSNKFLTVFLIGQVAQIIVALTPFNATNFIRPLHVSVAFLLAFTLPASMHLFRSAQNLSEKEKRLTSKFLQTELLLFVLGIGWFVIASSGGALAEIVTALTFDIWIIYLGLTKRDLN
jgi:hypothetical membrane protein